MKILAILLFFIPSVQSRDAVPSTAIQTSETPAFQSGEKLKYRVHYGLITAGYAELSVRQIERNGHEVYHVTGKGWSQGITEMLFRTREHYESFIRKEDYYPIEFIRDIDEGGYVTKRHIYFDQENLKAKDVLFDKDSLFHMNSKMLDIFSSLYYARSLDAKNLRKGQEIPMNIFLDHEDFNFKLKYLGKETIKVKKKGRIKCLKFRPMVQKGRVFNEEESATIWISDDDNKVPILLKSELLVGSIKMVLTDYNNLTHPITFK